MSAATDVAERRRRRVRTERTARWLILVAVAIANTIGAVIVFVLLAWVIPGPENGSDTPLWLSMVLAAVYAFVSGGLWLWWGVRQSRVGRRWLHGRDRPPTPEEQQSILRIPLHVFLASGFGWFLGALLFGTIHTITSGLEFGITVALTILLAGITTADVGYLIAELLLRPLASVVLEARPLERPALPGVTYRVLVAWAVGAAIPLIGLFLAGLSALVQEDFTRDQLAVMNIALAAAALVIGFLTILIAARVTSAPINAVRRAMRAVEEGTLDQHVPVLDGTEVGMLQSGFNRMVDGLAERERIRATFGQHVGEAVARQALEHGTDLGGEEREVAALFVDVVGSTTMASDHTPSEVVELLNRFFGVVVDTVVEHGGIVNKFEGDGALAVFGAPVALVDPAGAALRAGRELAQRLRDEAPDTPAVIGISHGTAVAGNVGAASRLEYTVIGDPINEAARLTEVAKEHPGGLAASGAALDAATDAERAHWHVTGEQQLRGRTAPTRIAVPR